ncbi:MAG TPA: helix-turn-helix domain-containing protein [Ignavibacteriales bacterium]|nr:helix-turn-helix domain-containing protein [Ignavibacteriales bacterium]HOL80548.1 helix-turn-helix domain-containing protein [Ignavibacteriales bacterium]HOM64237.1 helix-turn-helix domain-containing protein [Ignavibacteriales bacterium]HPD67289.1 helix-turn-helix domain-containing protein [Ignavibacteriales bacterium]HPP33116.1 helix-turn-helix domain-containing protein [Ignavibacteriales bacterium]
MVKNNIQNLSEVELNILNSAKEVFIQKGFDGANMQEIADKAGINKALLHYYFRKKELLFKEVFKMALIDFIPNIQQIMVSDKPLKTKIKIFVESYIDMLQKNPYLPNFIINELSRRPENLLSIIKELGLNPTLMIKSFEMSMKEAGVKLYLVKHLLINILSMCIFPVVAKPIISNFLFDNNTANYEAFIKQRKKFVYEFIIKALEL